MLPPGGVSPRGYDIPGSGGGEAVVDIRLALGLSPPIRMALTLCLAEMSGISPRDGRRRHIRSVGLRIPVRRRHARKSGRVVPRMSGRTGDRPHLLVAGQQLLRVCQRLAVRALQARRGPLLRHFASVLGRLLVVRCRLMVQRRCVGRRSHICVVACCNGETSSAPSMCGTYTRALAVILSTGGWRCGWQLVIVSDIIGVVCRGQSGGLPIRGFRTLFGARLRLEMRGEGVVHDGRVSRCRTPETDQCLYGHGTTSQPTSTRLCIQERIGPCKMPCAVEKGSNAQRFQLPEVGAPVTLRISETSSFSVSRKAQE
jgi:hypothetical protein